MEDRRIVFYDGECGLCNRIVQFILKNEKNDFLFFCSLNSEFANKFLTDHIGINGIDPNTFYYYHRNKIFTKSTAALMLLPNLKWYWQFLTLFWILPKQLRDWGYNQIALKRYRLMVQSCFLPDKKQRKRFLN